MDLWNRTAVAARATAAALCIAMLCSALLPSTANAWGQRGHRLIAELAQTQLTPKARLEVARLLAPEPGATLASISTWADEQRSPATAAWHYVNFPRTSCSYDAARDCAGGRCVVGALEQQLRILQSAPGDEARFLALKYVVHLAGDVHQPLHAGFADDRGGNSYQLQAFGKGTNLHALWDSGLLHNRVEDSSATLARLAQIGVPRAKRRVSVVQAAEESCGITSRPDFYPTRTLDDEYAIRFTPIMERQLALAGARLAELLNDALR